MTRGKDVVRRRCRGEGSLQRRGVSSCVQWKVNGTLPSAVFSISMHSSHWLADKVQRSTDCFFFPEPPGGVVPRGEGGRCQRIGPVSRPSGPKVRGLRDRFCPLSLHPLAARLGIPMANRGRVSSSGELRATAALGIDKGLVHGSQAFSQVGPHQYGGHLL